MPSDVIVYSPTRTENRPELLGSHRSFKAVKTVVAQ
jgi:hypothetical protein